MDSRKGLTLLLVNLAALAPAPSGAGLPSIIDLSLTEAPVTVTGPSGGKIGWSVCGGDFNGDSVADLAFTWRRIVTSTTPPRITILWSAQALDSSVDLANTSQSHSLIDGVNGDGSNWTSLACGDFNSDGIDDVALGVVNNSAFTNYDGKVHMIFGTPAFPDTLALASPSVPTTLFKGVPGSSGWLGYTMATGDVNNDGRDDLIVSAWAYWPGGRVYVIYGQDVFPAVVELAAPGSNITQVVDAYLYQGTGVGLASADVNNDGYDELLIGSPGNAEGFFQGTVSLLFGGPDLPAVIPLSNSTPGVKRFYGDDPDGQLGQRVGLGDVNGDGWRDLIMAAYTADPGGYDDCGEIDIVYWQEALPDSVHMGMPNIPMSRLIGQGYSTQHGKNMAVGEVDGDGFADVVLKKEPDDSMSPPERRAVLIAHGSSAMPDTILLRDDPTVTRIIAEQGGDDHGRGIAVVDLDGNSVDDVCIGAPFSTAGGNGGKVRIFFDCANATSTPVRAPIPLALYPNYPNPFSQSTSMRYVVERSTVSTISIYDVRGVRVREIKATTVDSNASVTWDGRDDHGRNMPSGVYFYRVDANGRSATRKMVLVR